LVLVLALCLIGSAGAHGAGASPYCPRPHELMRVSKRGALHYALPGPQDDFTIRALRHPRRGDLGWVEPGLPGGGFKTCDPRVKRLTWYIDLHPHGVDTPAGECHACDSHLYVVRYRNRKFATLEFSG
jgi:hypothetical protein